MNILIVTATKEELTIACDNHLVTGVGMVSTAIAVTQALGKKHYDLVINAGIAGSFNRSLTIGEVVEVNEDYLSELGAQDGNRFLSPEEMNVLMDYKVLMPSRSHLKPVKGITVNTVHGDDLSIMKTVHRLNPQVESMEGAACMLACQRSNISCVQIRSISNFVEKRNKSNWDIPKAIENLNTELQHFLSTL
jgi:futalosine hydrolase